MLFLSLFSIGAFAQEDSLPVINDSIELLPIDVYQRDTTDTVQDLQHNFWLDDSSDPGHYIDEGGILFHFVQKYLRSPESFEELFEYMVEVFGFQGFNREYVSDLCRTSVYTKYGADTCSYTGPPYYKDMTVYIYDTPQKTLEKYYLVYEESRYTQYAAMQLLVNFNHRYFDKNGKYIGDNDELSEDFRARRVSMNESYNSRLWVETQVDTVLARVFLKYSLQDGLSILGGLPHSDKVRYLERTGEQYQPITGTPESYSAEYLEELAGVCKEFLLEHDDIGSVIFLTYMRAKENAPIIKNGP